MMIKISMDVSNFDAGHSSSKCMGATEKKLQILKGRGPWAAQAPAGYGSSAPLGGQGGKDPLKLKQN